MIRSEVRAQVAANQPDVARASPGPDDHATKPGAVLPPQVDRPSAPPGPRRPPWLVRNSRKAAFVLGLAILAASPAAYRYLQREFGPDPLAGIKLDGVRIDAISGIAEVVKPPEAKPSAIKPVPAAGATEPAPKPRPSRPSASAAGPAVAAPAAPSFGVTHTRSAAAAPATPPMAERPEVLQKNASPRANASEAGTASRACSEAVAALGLCNPDATAKGK